MHVFWQSCRSEFEKELSPHQFNTWVKPLRFETDSDSFGFTVVAPNRHVLLWVKDRLLSKIDHEAEKYFARPVTVSLALENDSEINGAEKAPVLNKRSSDFADETTLATDLTDSELASPAILAVANNASATLHRVNPAFTFATFVGGKANQLARAAALQVAENLGQGYNPLFIYGPTGLGKTHLAQAIGNVVMGKNPKANIRYIHAEQFVTDVVKAYQHKAFDSFKRSYHSLDLLLIDDIQFLGGKSRTQEEFFYAFNALVGSGKQVVITCDRHPKEISGVEDRLVSRFGCGLTVSVEPPEYEMRVAILIKKAEADNTNLPEEVAKFIAKHIRSSVRELEGALKQVTAFARFNNTSITIGTATESLKNILAVLSRQVSLENIQKTVADYYKIKVAEMYSQKRVRSIARPRQIAMALAKDLTPMSLPEIGEAFGGRDHTTVLHACRKVKELIESDSNIARDHSLLLQILRG